MNSRASQRADELAGADPANRAPLAHPRQLAGRSRPRIRLRGARFGDRLETGRLNGRPGGREATRCAVRPLRGAGEPSLLAPRLDSVYTGSPTRAVDGPMGRMGLAHSSSRVVPRKRRETHIAGAVPPARLHAPSGAVVDDPTAAIALNLAAIGVAVPTIAGVRRRSSGSSASSVKWIQRYTAQPSGGAQVPRVM